MHQFPNQESNFLITGPVGDIEIIASPCAVTATPKNKIAIICHPHPLFEGTMHNKVVSTLHRTFSELGLKTVRFNFRGVGKSEGRYGDVKGEIQDLLAVVDWVKSVLPDDDVWLAGFSFGSYVSAYVATQIRVEKLISIAPPVTNLPFKDLPTINCDWIIVQGDLDEIVEANAVYDFIDSLSSKPKLIRIHDATHFFHRKLLDLREKLQAVLRGGTS